MQCYQYQVSSIDRRDTSVGYRLCSGSQVVARRKKRPSVCCMYSLPLMIAYIDGNNTFFAKRKMSVFVVGSRRVVMMMMNVSCGGGTMRPINGAVRVYRRWFVLERRIEQNAEGV